MMLIRRVRLRRRRSCRPARPSYRAPRDTARDLTYDAGHTYDDQPYAQAHITIVRGLNFRQLGPFRGAILGETVPLTITTPDIPGWR